MGHYFTVLLRTVSREKLYTAINIAGLALGVACCLILGQFLRSELTYDQHYPDHANIYRVVNEFTTGGSNDKFAVTSSALGPMLKEQYPNEVLDYVRFQSNANRGGVAIHRGDDTFYWEHSYFVDPNVFDLFPVEVIYGDPKTALAEGGNIAVSETFARKYFGEANPIGETFTTDGGVAQKITLVFRDQPANTHLKYDMLWSNNLPFLRAADNNPSLRRQQLIGIGILTYVRMAPGFNPADFGRISDEFRDRNMAEALRSFGAEWRSWLQPLAEVHMQTEVQDQQPTGNRLYLYGCAAVALFILLVACINYMNLATARATRRARSVGIRKTLGASRASLALQFLAEAVAFSVIAMVLGVVIVEIVLTFTPINQLMDNQVKLDLTGDPKLVGWLLGGAVLIGLLAGAYPAFYLSSWAPLTALAGKQLAGKGSLRLREALVLVQFTVSAAVIAATLLMAAQMRYVATRSLGFEREHRLFVTMRGVTTIDKHAAIRNELAKDPNILETGIALTRPGEGMPVNVAQIEGEDGTMGPNQLNNQAVGENYFEVMGVKLIAGRGFNQRLLTDVGSNFVVNEALVKKMGWSEPLGKRINVRGENGRVVGVVQDFNFKSLHTPIEPLAMYPLIMDTSRIADINKPFVLNLLVLKLSGKDTAKTLSNIERIMSEADPKHPFEFYFLDDTLNQLYKEDNRLLGLISIFAGVCIFIACLGLFGLASFTTEQRTREIGTRKVLGATTMQIVALLARPVMVLVVIASVLAAVIAWFAIDEWLTTFAYRADINYLIFVLAAAVAATVAFVTVALQSWRTASADPVKTLKFN